MPDAIEPVIAASADDFERLCAFLSEQGLGKGADVAQYRQTRSRADLGISSLEVIVLVANYMGLRGVDTAGFKPEWVSQLDDIAGILSVMREIDRQAGRA